MNMGLDLMRQADLSVENNQVVFTGKVDFPLHGPGGVCFEGRIAVLADNGEVKMEQSGVSIKEADAVTLIGDVRTAVSYTHLDVYKRQEIRWKDCFLNT